MSVQRAFNLLPKSFMGANSDYVYCLFFLVCKISNHPGRSGIIKTVTIHTPKIANLAFLPGLCGNLIQTPAESLYQPAVFYFSQLFFRPRQQYNFIHRQHRPSL